MFPVPRTPEIKLLEILAGSGTAFSDTLASYRVIIFVLMLFATGLLIAALVFLVMLVQMNRRMAESARTRPSGDRCPVSAMPAPSAHMIFSL